MIATPYQPSISINHSDKRKQQLAPIVVKDSKKKQAKKEAPATINVVSDKPADMILTVDQKVE